MAVKAKLVLVLLVNLCPFQHRLLDKQEDRCLKRQFLRVRGQNLAGLNPRGHPKSTLQMLRLRYMKKLEIFAILYLALNQKRR